LVRVAEQICVSRVAARHEARQVRGRHQNFGLLFAGNGYRGIALSGFCTTPPGSIQLGGVAALF
jgi:hypothetical protein